VSPSLKEYIEYRKERALELYSDAKLLANHGSYRSSVNRLYYAIFHMTGALLSLDEVSAKTHEGLKTKFFQLYIKSNKVDHSFGKLYTRLLDWRLESDYSVISEFNSEELTKALKETGEFLEVLSEIIDNSLS
jgi:uncharacterized protein (UPF0332 family)